MKYLKLLVLLLLTGCATEEGQTYTAYFYKSPTCTLGYTHTYGEKIRGIHQCFNNWRIEIDDSWLEGDSVEGALVWRVQIDPDFSPYKTVTPTEKAPPPPENTDSKPFQRITPELTD
jgi:hypothetical protein